MSGNKLFFPSAVWLDNRPLTDQGRSPITSQKDERSIIIELASGKRKRYVKAVKHKFSMSWSWLPDSEDDTIDGGLGRTKLNEVLYENSDTHTLRFYDRNGGYKEFVVFVNSYSEVLTRRDPHTGTHFWEVALELEEQ